MAIIAGVGRSDETETKQEHLRKILIPHMQIVKGIMGRHKILCKYLFIDMNAGRGFYPDSHFLFGSPIVAIQCAQQVGIEARFLFIEENKENADFLNAYLGSNYNSAEYQILNDDHNHAVKSIVAELSNLPSVYGMAYNDPNGTPPSFDALRRIAEVAKRLDILVYVAATNIKRLSKATRQPISLRNGLLSLNKKCWIVRQPRKQHQWTFAFGSNWEGYPAFNGMGFHNINTSIGQMIIDKLDLTNEEFKKKNCLHQLPLFNVQRISPSPQVLGSKSKGNGEGETSLPEMQMQ